MADDPYAVDRDELIARLRADLGSEASSELDTSLQAVAADVGDDTTAGGSSPEFTVSVSESALTMADRILAAASASMSR